jgi:hypothetical protein
MLVSRGAFNRLINRDETIAFPVGSYKFGHSSYITLSPDHTFRVESNDELLWRCVGTWSYDSKTITMHPDGGKSRSEWMPFIFSSPATLISNGKELVVWKTFIDTAEWKKIDN